MLEELKELGINIEEGIHRLMNNEDLYKRMLKAFAEMVEESCVTSDFDEKSVDSEIEKIHALKGAAGNLAIDPLFSAYTEIVRRLRTGDIAAAKTAITNVLPKQNKIVACIEKY